MTQTFINIIPIIITTQHTRYLYTYDTHIHHQTAHLVPVPKDTNSLPTIHLF